MTNWTEQDEMDLRAEMARRFEARTPPTRVDEVILGTRVTRGEMRAWSMQVLGKSIPEVEDLDLSRERCRWYRQMALRVIKQKDPAALNKARAEFRKARTW